DCLTAHGRGTAHGAHGMVDLCGRRVEERHEAIPHDLVHEAAVFDDHVGKEGVVLVEDLHDFVRWELCGERCEVGKVEKEHGHQFTRTAQLGRCRAAQQAFDQRF